MSCYAVYRPTADTLESDRSVLSNIHREGTPPVEAAAVIVDLVRDMLHWKASGIKLNRRQAGDAGRMTPSAGRDAGTGKGEAHAQ
ncbi:ethanolamine ammonia-lyase light chain EutC [Bilophila wadsworthia]|uniref:ethanolamine ammonia-lyase light chain EutC n=1 Tax=Bilophila wadsworthia TaxID=35833 RepID=UPI0035226A04